MKAILMIDMPENCRKCGICLMITEPTPEHFVTDRCPLIPLTEYEEARINEILKEREANDETFR